ncbi:hypothetical protein [Aneurinibacillus tyrosinisolvens]|jgi:hypothetical protein|uniref:hypothetical protein n=1 Tax=Aneurinibacillus tyrosinisolvens TaxID=1443435 RepID=UPI00063F64F2|nr:hypothetical protein [Aneurinibacillus tyrosinisolvens]
MLDKSLLTKTTVDYTDEQLDAIANGCCPKCLPTFNRYRILEASYNTELNMELLHVKCSNIVECEWDEQIPNSRPDPGLEGFFTS